jgi:hypothetical protein
MLTVVNVVPSKLTILSQYAGCHYAEYRYAESRYAKFCYVECRLAEFHD